MKYLIALLTLCLCSACATRKPVKIQSSPAVAGISRNDMPGVRIPETVKAYPAGRYTDPNYPNEMHERHTVYRREQSADWNYRPSVPYALPMGPTAAKSNPSPGYFQVTDEEQRSAQQKAYAEALLEQNRAMKKRVEDLQREAAKVPELQQEVERLKSQPDFSPSPSPSPIKSSNDDAFSSAEPPLPEGEGISDPCGIVLFAEANDECQAFLLSQMQLNDEFAAELESLERRRRESLFPGPLLRRKQFAFLTKNTL
jgi:hypothetical protein